MAVQVRSDVAWEIVVVNNHSSDHTDDVISEYVGRLPVRREFEPLAGKSNGIPVLALRRRFSAVSGPGLAIVVPYNARLKLRTALLSEVYRLIRYDDDFHPWFIFGVSRMLSPVCWEPSYPLRPLKNPATSR
jgi:hypothetical protein